MTETVGFSELRAELEDRETVHITVSHYINGETAERPEDITLPGDEVAQYLEQVDQYNVDEPVDYEGLPDPDKVDLPSEKVEVESEAGTEFRDDEDYDSFIVTQFDVVEDTGKGSFDSTGESEKYNLSVFAE